MKTIKGPGIFLAQFIGERPPFNTLEGVAKWAAELGYKALQIPCNHKSLFDVEQAAVSQAYCDDIRGMLAGHGLVISELSTHLEVNWLQSIRLMMTLLTDLLRHLYALIRRPDRRGPSKPYTRPLRLRKDWG